jgi:hypothetical protein
MRPAKRLRRRTKILLWSLSPFVLGGVLWSYTGLRLERAIEDERAQLKLLGAVTSIDDYVALSSHDGTDASPELRKAFELFTAIPADLVGGFNPNKSDSTISKQEAFFAESFKPVYELLRSASKKDSLRFNRTADSLIWNSPNAVPGSSAVSSMPVEIGFYRRLRSYLAKYSYHLAKTGDAERAIGAVETLHGLADLKKKVPTVWFMPGWQVDSAGEDSMSVHVAQLLADKEHIRSILKLIDHDRELPSTKYFYSGEPLLGELEALNNVNEPLDFKGIFKGKFPTKEQLYLATPRGKSTVSLEVLRAWRVVFEQMPKDEWDSKGIRKAHEAGEMHVLNLEGAVGKASQLFFLPSWQLKELPLMAQAGRRTARTALRLLLHKAEHGSFPAALPDYGEASLDPFSKKPLRLFRDARHLYIYSVGVDRVDNKGSWSEEAGLIKLRL